MTPARGTPSTRDRLLEAALAELDRNGYRGARVSAIASSAGLTTGAIYSSFRTKHDLLVAALARRDPAAVDAARSSPPPSSAERPILDAAIDVLDKVGYRRATIAAAAAQAALSTSEVRAQYPTKSALYVTAIVSMDASPAASAATDLPIGGETTRERLLVAALAALDDVGYQRATVADIARRAGLTTGAIYRIFESKEELLGEAMARRYEDLFQTALGEAGEHDPLDALVHLLERDARVEHTALIEVFAAAARDEPVRAIIRNEIDRRQSEIEDTIQGASLAGLVRADVDASTLAHLVQLIALGNVVGQSLGLTPPDDAAMRSTFERFGKSLLPPPS